MRQIVISPYYYPISAAIKGVSSVAPIQTDDLPAWMQDLILQCRLDGDFTKLAVLLEFDSTRLQKAVLHELYQLATPAFVAKARKFYAHFRVGRIECAYNLRRLRDKVKAGGGLDLKAELQLSDADWEAVVYMERVYHLKHAYELGLRGEMYHARNVKHHLADNLLATPSAHIEPWEFDADPDVVERLARESYQSQVEGWIARCRKGEVRYAARLQEVVNRLRYELSALGLTQKVLQDWARKDHIISIRSQLGFSLDSEFEPTDELTLFLNSAGPLRLMLEHKIKPEEAGIDRNKLAASYRRLVTWLPKAIRRPYEEANSMASRERLQTYQAVVLPLFDRVLAL